MAQLKYQDIQIGDKVKCTLKEFGYAERPGYTGIVIKENSVDLYIVAIDGFGTDVSGNPRTSIFSRKELTVIYRKGSECPKCKNENLPGRYCPICGFELESEV